MQSEPLLLPKDSDSKTTIAGLTLIATALWILVFVSLQKMRMDEAERWLDAIAAIVLVGVILVGGPYLPKVWSIFLNHHPMTFVLVLLVGTMLLWANFHPRLGRLVRPERFDFLSISCGCPFRVYGTDLKYIKDSGRIGVIESNGLSVAGLSIDIAFAYGVLIVTTLLSEKAFKKLRKKLGNGAGEALKNQSLA